MAKVVPSQVQNVVNQIISSGESVGSGTIHGYFENFITGVNEVWKTNRAAKVLTEIQDMLNNMKKEIIRVLNNDNEAIIAAANSALISEEQDTIPAPNTITNTDIAVEIINASDEGGIYINPEKLTSKMAYLGTIKGFFHSIVVENIKSAARNNPLAFEGMGQTELSASLSGLANSIDTQFEEIKNKLNESGEDIAAQQQSIISSTQSDLTSN